jgi:lipoprotein-anchoring transpeptidase ErfK/SrfK
MVDYYSILAKAMNTPEAADARWRRGIYERARDMLVTRLQARQPPTSPKAIAAERSALDDAIARIEAEMSSSPDNSDAANEPAGYGDDDLMSAPSIVPEREPMALPVQFSGVGWVVIAFVVAALCAGGYVFWVQHAHRAAPPAARNSAPGTTAPAAPAVKVAAAKDGDLAPGVDGGNADSDLPYVFRRQSTFYRTLQPVGTVIVDKLQHFLYLIQPNNVALRYGIGLGQQCADLVGLRHVASKAEWPPWQATPDMIAKKLAKPGTMPGGPGNPLGARAMELDDGSSRINGTNAPATVGTSVAFGCVRLGNDDVVDLYGRVKDGTAVVVN